MLQKFDDVSQDVFTYIEDVITLTQEELDSQRRNAARKVDSNIKQEFTLKSTSPDFCFGMWGNVAARTQTIRKIEF